MQNRLAEINEVFDKYQYSSHGLRTLNIYNRDGNKILSRLANSDQTMKLYDLPFTIGLRRNGNEFDILMNLE